MPFPQDLSIVGRTGDTGTCPVLGIDKVSPFKGFHLVVDVYKRQVTMYAPLTDSEEAEKEAMLYNTQLVISPVPLSESKFKDELSRQ